MQIRRFGPEMKSKIPGGHPGLYGVPISLDRANLNVPEGELAERMNGLPILLNRPMWVIAMYLDAHSQMEEHSAAEPIIFIVTRGNGFMRIGGPNGETATVAAGDAVL